MVYEAYRVRRKFQWQVFQYAPPGQCQCSTDPGSNVITTRFKVNEQGKPETGKFDGNPCYGNKVFCLGQTGAGCTCNDAGYCTCSIKPWMYGGDIWLVAERDIRKEHILLRRFAIYDPTLKPAEKYLEEKRYKILTMGEPNPDQILFPPEGERIIGIPDSEVEVPPVDEDLSVKEALKVMAGATP